MGECGDAGVRGRWIRQNMVQGCRRVPDLLLQLFAVRHFAQRRSTRAGVDVQQVRDAHTEPAAPSCLLSAFIVVRQEGLRGRERVWGAKRGRGKERCY
jgi:hypothetical protein